MALYHAPAMGASEDVPIMGAPTLVKIDRYGASDLSLVALLKPRLNSTAEHQPDRFIGRLRVIRSEIVMGCHKTFTFIRKHLFYDAVSLLIK